MPWLHHEPQSVQDIEDGGTLSGGAGSAEVVATLVQAGKLACAKTIDVDARES